MNISLGKFKERGILMKVYQIRIKLYLLKIYSKTEVPNIKEEVLIKILNEQMS